MRGTTLATAVWVVTRAALVRTSVTAQDVELLVAFDDGSSLGVPISFQEGPTAVPLEIFSRLGWSVTELPGEIRIEGPDDVVASMRLGSPFLRWADQAVHLTDSPYSDQGRIFVPLQLVSEVLVGGLAEHYRFDAETLTLRAAVPSSWGGIIREDGSVGTPSAVGETTIGDGTRSVDREEAGFEDAVSRPDTQIFIAPPDINGPRVVIIDPGHGGGDPGALGLGGVREKDVSLAVGLALARQLAEHEGLEVHLTRSSDRFVPLWERGELATEWKGDRPGIFISIHANSLPSRRSLRGYETYFLAESRTDHERRLTAIENAPLSVAGQEFDPAAMPEISSILRNLRAHGLENWSSLLAEFVQAEMAQFHPGPDRGVRQGVLAVLTNALMPSVLVEVGYLSNADEAAILGQSEFQEQAAAAVARAVLVFFDRYPPGAPGLGR